MHSFNLDWFMSFGIDSVDAYPVWSRNSRGGELTGPTEGCLNYILDTFCRTDNDKRKPDCAER